MKKWSKFFILFCFSALILCGCKSGKTKPKALTRVVTQVDISCQRQDMQIARHYTDNAKMQSVLLYLRLLQPVETSMPNPDLLKHNVFQITVHLSDGKKRIFRQAGHRYFSKDYRPWETIDPGYASRLYILLQKLPSDPTFAGNLPYFSSTNC